jgi:diguanylate cyclase
MAHFAGYPSFSAAAVAVMSHLRERLGFKLWMVTRTEDNDWIVLDCDDHGYGVKPGTVFRWADSFCSQMVLGRGPCIAPDSNQVPAYAAAPIGQQVPIGAYIGIPLTDADGGLFGTLCAVDPERQDEKLVLDLPLVTLMGRLLSTCLISELKLSTIERRQSLKGLERLVNPTNGLFTDEGWGKIVEAEESRCKKYASPTCIIAVKTHDRLDDLAISQILRESCTGNDAVHQTEDGVFLILVPECKTATAQEKLTTIESLLRDRNVDARLEREMRDPRKDLEAAIQAVLMRVTSSL